MHHACVICYALLQLHVPNKENSLLLYCPSGSSYHLIWWSIQLSIVTWVTWLPHLPYSLLIPSCPNLPSWFYNLCSWYYHYRYSTNNCCKLLQSLCLMINTILRAWACSILNVATSRHNPCSLSYYTVIKVIKLMYDWPLQQKIRGNHVSLFVAFVSIFATRPLNILLW